MNSKSQLMKGNSHISIKQAKNIIHEEDGVTYSFVTQKLQNGRLDYDVLQQLKLLAADAGSLPGRTILVP